LANQIGITEVSTPRNWSFWLFISVPYTITDLQSPYTL